MRAPADSDPNVALEACKFLLTFALLDEEVCDAGIMMAVSLPFSRLLTRLLKGVVYPTHKIEELM